jgi:4-coumarate--CoA ligase
MVHAFKTVGARYVICYEETLKIVREAARKCGIEEREILVLGRRADGVTSVETCLKKECA